MVFLSVNLKCDEELICVVYILTHFYSLENIKGVIYNSTRPFP